MYSKDKDLPKTLRTQIRGAQLQAMYRKNIFILKNRFFNGALLKHVYASKLRSSFY
jgi:hypothetical protein